MIFVNVYEMRQRIDKKQTARKKVVIHHDGRRWFNLTRYLPATMQTNKGWIVIEDDFSSIINDLRRDGKRFIIRENKRKQRALFVEEKMRSVAA